jgi:hypothetical protein
MQQWAYLSITIEHLERPAERVGDDVTVEGWGTRETGPIGKVDEVLDRYGTDGWELVSLIPQEWSSFERNPLSKDSAGSVVTSFRATFKRPTP